MIERKFTEDRLAALYDAFSPPSGWRDDFAFYLPLMMAARAVLDVGCGTGALLHLARERGHTGLLGDASLSSVRGQRIDGHTTPHDIGHGASVRLARNPVAPLCSLALHPQFRPGSVKHASETIQGDCQVSICSYGYGACAVRWRGGAQQHGPTHRFRASAAPQGASGATLQSPWETIRSVWLQYVSWKADLDGFAAAREQGTASGDVAGLTDAHNRGRAHGNRKRRGVNSPTAMVCALGNIVTPGGKPRVIQRCIEP